MVDSTFRHPKLALLLTLAGMCVALVAVMGPRSGGVVGVGDASAEETTSTTIDPNYDDGVVFTTPGELVSVLEEPVVLEEPGSSPEGSQDGGVIGSTSGSSVVASSSTSSPTSTTPAVADDGTDTDGSSDEAADIPEADAVDDGETSDEVAGPVNGDGVVEVVAVDGELQAAAVNVSFDDLPPLRGSARGAPQPEEVLLGQLGTRDANSTPWMLLIGANFVVAGFALVALRLRR